MKIPKREPIIYKYELERVDSQLVKMPEKSEILDIQIQNGNIVMWALVEPDSKKINVNIVIYGTGNPIFEDTADNTYLGTVQDGSFVWHFFMNSEQ